MAKNRLEYALETILREAGKPSAPALKLSSNKNQISPKSKLLANEINPEFTEYEPAEKGGQSDPSHQSASVSLSALDEPSVDKLDMALHSLLKDAEEQAQNAKNNGISTRSFGLDPAAERRQALREQARRRAELREGIDTGDVKETPKPFYERIDPKTARILMILPLVFVVCFFMYCIFVWPVRASVTIEAGSSVPMASEYAWFSWQRIRYATADETATYLQTHQGLSDQIDTMLPGRYSVFVRFGLITYERGLLVADTTPPVLEGEFHKTANIGTPFSYRQGIVVTDNSSAPVTLSVEAETVDLQKVGEYPVLYIATDSTGNRTAVEGSVNVIVAPQPPQNEEEAEVLQLSEELMAEITGPEMSYEEKARAIYDWEQEMLTFRETNQGADNVTGNALQGLKNREGDCHVFAAVAEVLLTNAGIPNRRIENTAGENVHEWNLINLGAGWHHFDAVTAQRVPKGELFNVTSAELDEKATKKGFIHDFDAGHYPAIE